jgi:hypothetical protein
MVQLAMLPPLLLKMSRSTARYPALSRNVCRNVYQSEVVMCTGVRQIFGGADGAGQVFCGLELSRNVLVLALTSNPGGLRSVARLVPALKSKSRRWVPAALLIAEM